jgi:hypothetical protein
MAEKQVNLNVEFAAGGAARKRMFFNRFEVEHVDHQPLFRFALMRESPGPILDSFNCVMPRLDLRSQQGEAPQFYHAIGTHLARKGQWVGSAI